MKGKPTGGPTPGKTPKPAALSSYVPGAKPSLPGIYVPFDSTPDALALQLEELQRPVPEPKDPWGYLRRARLVLTLLLLGLSLGSCVIDRALGFEQAIFVMLTPFVWLGIVLVFAATRPPGPRWPRVSQGLGCLGGVALAAVLMFAVFVINHSMAGTHAVAWVLGTAVTIGVAWIFGRSSPSSKLNLAPVRARLAAAHGVLKALADDVAPGKRVGGWLELTGWDQPGKLVREAKAHSGAAVQLYRDEWWRLRLPLRDGNELRVSGVDRVKARREHWKRNARGKSKRKSGRTEELHTLEVRLAVNAALYRIKPAAAEAVHIGQLTLPPPALADGAIAYVVPLDSFTADEALGVLASLYRQLEPLQRAAGG